MQMSILPASALVMSVMAFTMAMVLLARHIRNKLAISFAILCITLSCWAFSFYLTKFFNSSFIEKIHLTFNLLIAPAGLNFVRSVAPADSKLSRLIFVTCLVLTPIFMVVFWFDYGQSKAIINLVRAWPQFVTFECLHILVRLLYRRKKWNQLSQNHNLKQPTKTRIWLYAGGIVILSTAVLDHVSWIGEIIPTIGNGLICVYLYIVNEIIIHQRLLNITVLLNRLLVIAFLSACFTLLFSMMVAWTNRYSALFVLNSFLAVFLMIVLVDPLRNLLTSGIYRVFNRNALYYEEKIKKAIAQLVGVTELRDLTNKILLFLNQEFDLESASVFILRSDETVYVRVDGIDDRQLSIQSLLSNHRFIDFFRWLDQKSYSPIILDRFVETELARSMSVLQKNIFNEVLATLKSLNSNIAIPLIIKKEEKLEIHGFISMKGKKPPNAWDEDWSVLSLVYPYFIECAQKLSNLDVYKRQRERERLATLGEMSAGLAHEIRNPLGAIKGAAQLLEQNIKDKSSQQAQSEPFLNVILEEVDRLNKVVSQFLDYSKPISVREKSFINVQYLLDRTMDFLKSSFYNEISNKNIHFEVVPPKVGFENIPELHCVPEQIKQVLINLLQNSIHSLRRQEGNSNPQIKMGVEITPHRLNMVTSEADRDLNIYVEDNGCGFTADKIEKIFLPFYTENSKGTGLGLSISAKIIESHGGLIEAFSEPNKITRFTLVLPIDEKAVNGN